mgnify:CR=1 FL=1
MRSSSADAEQAIVNTVSYVDAFDYPLTLAEIHRYLVQVPLSADGLEHILDQGRLVPARLSVRNGLYMLPGREDLALLRRERQQVSARLWPAAIRYGLLISRMPFVRMVAVTGSLAVNNVDAREDIDYLVVTADDHLWVSRAFVLLLVRWAARRGLELCPNYFLSERALRFGEQNLYTAHEVTQMVPLFGQPVYDALRLVNSWTHRYLPNASGPPTPPSQVGAVQQQAGRQPARELLEAAFATPPGRWLDRWEMTRKISKFQRVYYDSQEANFTADICKGHFNQHQQRAIEAYARRVASRSDELTAVTRP